MKKLSGNLRIILLSVIILTAICVTLLTVSLFVSYDQAINYFNRSLIYSISKALVAITVIGTVVFTFMLPKNELSGASPTTLPISIVSSLPAIALCAFSVSVFSGALKIVGNSNLFSIVCAVFAAISSVYFIFNCIFADGKNSVKVYLGYFVPLTSIMLIAITYFDMSVSMNAPAKVFLNFAFVSFALWSLLELRTMTEKSHPRAYFALGLITTVLTASASLPWIIATLAGKLGKPIYPSYIIFNVTVFALFIYVLTRMIVFVSARALIERLSEQTYSDDTPKAQQEDNKSEEV